MSAPPRDRPLFVLALAAALGGAFGGFVVHAPNRVADGVGLSLAEAPGPYGALVMTLVALMGALAFVKDERVRSRAALAVGLALALACLAAAGAFAARLAEGAKPAARTSLGPAFWIMLCAALAGVSTALRRLRPPRPAGAAVWAALALGACALAALGARDRLALAQAYMQRRAEFWSALSTHMALAGASVGAAAVASVGLAALALRRPAARDALFQTLGVLQTLPSLALFGALIAPLTALAARFPKLAEWGVAGVGATPALIALTLYALGPLTRGFVVALEGVAADVKEAGRGLGFGARSLLASVELPLAAPALISALRVASAQAIGLAAVAALIGAGGLGVFIFEGIGRYAPDLVLLGALPVVGLALAVDAGFAAAIAAARGRL
ncbi:ABC transporter permease [Methylocella sp.]|uniref:ABC transporter permease n=1 Tax=Methylocella sp. TaxID=1978226 RepID=UPI0037830FB5